MHTTPRPATSIVGLALFGFLTISAGSCGSDSPTTPPPPKTVQLRVFADLSAAGPSATTLDIVVDPYNTPPTRTYTLPAVDHIVDETIEVPVGPSRRLSASVPGTVYTGTVVQDVGPGVTRTAAIPLGGFFVMVGSVVTEVRPGGATLRMGSAAQLSASAVDTAGAIPGAVVGWSSDHPEIATVDNTGRVTAMAPGLAKISASIGGSTGYAVVQATDTTALTGDNAKPVLVAFSFSPDTIDVTSDSALVTASFTLADSLSGVATVMAEFEDTRRTCFADTPVSGSRISGTWQCGIYFQRGSPAADARVRVLQVTDRAGNQLTSSPELEFPYPYPKLHVINSAQDTTGAVLTSFSVAPDTLDFATTSGSLTLGIDLGLSDPESGVDSIQVTVHGPNVSDQTRCNSMKLIAGTRLNGTWACPITLPPTVKPGTWTIEQVSILNVAEIGTGFDSTALVDAGFPATFQVRAGVADTTRPVLTAFSLTPDTVDVRTDSAVVTARFTATDVGSGVGRITLGLGGSQRCTALTLESGTPANGTWSCRATIPYLSIGGAWDVGVSVIDRYGNVAGYSGASLQALGAPSELHVLSAVTR